MTMRTIALVASATLSGCALPPAQPATMVRVFGPVMARDVIAGRAEERDPRAPVRLLVAERDLLTIDVDSRSATRRPLDVGPASRCWGLARLDDGTMWTLRDWRILARVDATGRIAQEVGLPEPYEGVFGAGDRLVLQPASFVAGAQALFSGTPGGRMTEPWSTLRQRPFSLPHASAAAMNLVKCGAAAGDERPCWFPEENAVFLVTRAGRTRRIDLRGIEAVAPEDLLAAENPRRPVRDALVDERGTLWVLGAGTPGKTHSEVPGASLLAHYSSSGAPLDFRTLEVPARLLLRVDGNRVVILTGSGDVAEVLL